MSWVASLRSRTASDDPSAMMSIGLGGVIFETHLAGLLDVEIALGLAAVGADLHEISDQRLQRRQIGAHLGGLCLLIGVEARKNIGRHIPARIGNHRIRRRCRSRAGRDRALSAASDALDLYAFARLRRGLWDRELSARTQTTMARRRRPTAAAISNANPCAVQRLAGPSKSWISGAWISRKFWISIQRVVLSGLLTFYRGFDQRRYRFSVKINCNPGNSLRPMMPLKSRFLLPRPEFRVFRRDWPGRRCLRVPSAPSARRRGYIRSAAGAGCSWWRPCGRA